MKKKDCEFDLSKITGHEPPLIIECENCENLNEQLDDALAEIERLEKRPTEDEWNHLVDCDAKKAEHIMELCDENLVLLKKYEPEKVISLEVACKKLRDMRQKDKP